MGETPEPGKETLLNPDGISQVHVYHRDGLVWIVGYDQVITLSYQEALRLAQWLEQASDFLQDRVKNYYTCRECGQIHHRSVKACPQISGGQ